MDKKIISEKLQLKKLEELLSTEQFFEIPFEELKKTYTILETTVPHKPTLYVVDAYLANLLTINRMARRHYFEILPLTTIEPFFESRRKFYEILINEYDHPEAVFDKPLKAYKSTEPHELFQNAAIRNVITYFKERLAAKKDPFPARIFRFFDRGIPCTLKESAAAIGRYAQAYHTNTNIIKFKEAYHTHNAKRAEDALHKFISQSYD